LTPQSDSAAAHLGVCPVIPAEADILRPVHARIEAYYADKISRHGAGPRGVDWTCTATQELRFVQLLKLCDFSRPFLLNDVGCGYGALVGFVARRHPEADIDYLGIDLSPAMISRARRRHRDAQGCRFVVGNEIPRRLRCGERRDERHARSSARPLGGIHRRYSAPHARVEPARLCRQLHG
jgi:SAM-dependent methyltransferase